MTPVETILLARQYGISLGVNGDKLLVKSDEQPPDELLAALRENKPALVRMILTPAGEPCPVEPCRTCKLELWWQRPASNGGGWVCGVCHPDPELLRSGWVAS